MGVQHCGNSVLSGAEGELDEDAGGVLLQALDRVTADERDLLVDLHGVTVMDTDGLFHLLHLHRHAELLRLRVLVTRRPAWPATCDAVSGRARRARISSAAPVTHSSSFRDRV
ncbi:hypothetical protein [Streptomyces virginiae]